MREFLLHNLRRKIISLVLAVVIWLTIDFVIKNERRALPPPLVAATNAPTIIPP